MKRAIQNVVGAGGLFVLVLAGCTDFSGSVLTQSTTGDNEQTILASIDAVALTLEASLGKAGMRVTASAREDGSVVLDSATKKGERFRLHLKQGDSSQGTVTRVRVEWLDARDGLVAVALGEVIREAGTTIRTEKRGGKEK